MVDHVAGVLEDGLAEGVARVVDVRVGAPAVGEVVEAAQRLQQPLALDRRHRRARRCRENARQ